jgi:thioredoxin-related protein
MKNMNPIAILILLTGILLFIVLKLGEAKNKQYELQQENREIEQTGQRLDALRDIWRNGSDVSNEIKKLLKSKRLAGDVIKQRINNNTIEIRSAAMNIDAISYLLNKLLNGNYRIKHLEVKRVDALNASILVEIAL